MTDEAFHAYRVYQIFKIMSEHMAQGKQQLKFERKEIIVMQTDKFYYELCRHGQANLK